MAGPQRSYPQSRNCQLRITANGECADRQRGGGGQQRDRVPEGTFFSWKLPGLRPAGHFRRARAVAIRTIVLPLNTESSAMSTPSTARRVLLWRAKQHSHATAQPRNHTPRQCRSQQPTPHTDRRHGAQCCFGAESSTPCADNKRVLLGRPKQHIHAHRVWPTSSCCFGVKAARRVRGNGSCCFDAQSSTTQKHTPEKADGYIIAISVSRRHRFSLLVVGAPSAAASDPILTAASLPCAWARLACAASRACTRKVS